MAGTKIIDVLEFLLDEGGYNLGHHHHHSQGHNQTHHAASNSNRHAISHMDSWARLTLLDQLLCIRPADPELPPDVAELAGGILRDRLARRLATLSSSTAPRYRTSATAPRIRNSRTPPPSLPSPKGPELSIWKGDITTLARATAVVNAANSRLLGCFQPRHPCIDNAIHASAGPGLRRACWELAAARGGAEEPVGSARVTPGFNLHAKYVIHTVGPQLGRRGAVAVVVQEPSAENRRALASCYASCLDAAEGLEPLPDGRKVLVLCCISTGMFGFPAGEGCHVAVDTVLSWLERHPGTSLTDIIFNVFTDDDLEIYRARFAQLIEDMALLPLSPDNGNDALSPLDMSPSTTTITTPLLDQQTALISRARSWLATSSRLIISAGAGLSAAAGLDYTSRALFTEHHKGFEKYGLHSLYSVFGFDGWPSEVARWSYNTRHLDVVRRWPRSRLYDGLRALARRRFEGGNSQDDDEKRWFVRTSNADGFFAKHGLEPARICTPQGQYALVQCAARCREGAVWPAEPLVDEAMNRIDPVTQHLPDGYEVPVCRFCGAGLTPCVRGGDYFIEEPFEEQNRRYAEFVEECLATEAVEGAGVSEKGTEGAAMTTILELGVGMNTPSVLRWHNENLVQRVKGKLRLVRLGIDAAGCVDPALEEAGLAIGLYGDLTRLFEVFDIK